MKKPWEILKIHPVIIGIALSVFVVGIMSVYELGIRVSTENPKYINQDLSRPQTVEKINCPEILVEYLVEALGEQDIDKALRGFSIDESIMKVSVRNEINKQEMFYTDMMIAPSGHYDIYNEISAAELSGKYVREFEYILKELPNFEKAEIKSIDIVLPDVQKSKEYQSKGQKFSEVWGGDCMTEMMVLLEYEQKNYLLGLTMNHYKDYWKIIDLGSELTSTTNEKPIREITEDEYKKLRETQTIKSYMNDLQKELKVEDMELYGKENIEVENMLFSPNYFILNSLKEDTPEQVIEKFIVCIERKDLTSAMAYCMPENVTADDKTTIDLIKKQEKIAKELKRFCYGFLGYDYQNEEKLDQIGKSGSKIIDGLDPKYFMYFDWSDIILVDQQENLREYIVGCHYEGEKYISGFTLVNQDGWHIQSLSSNKFGIEPGENRKVTDQEYEKILKVWDEK